MTKTYFLKREFYKVTNKNYSDNKINTSAWLKGRGITQCCQCLAWDNTKNKYKVCPVCLEIKEEESKARFLKFRKRQGIDLELVY